MKRISFRQLLLLFLPAALVLAAVLLARVRYGVPIAKLTGDVAWMAGLNPLSGFVSSLGMILWSATLAICVFTATLLTRTNQTEMRRFLAWSAALTGYLLLDDLFLIHDDLVERYLHIHEWPVFVLLGTAVALYFFTFRATILRTDITLLLLALGFFGLSVVLDQFVTEVVAPGHGVYFLEDGSKWLGIIAWFGYFTRTSYLLVASAIRNATAETRPTTQDASEVAA